MEDSQEDSDQKSLERTVNSFYRYKDYALDEYWKPRVQKWNSLSVYQQEMIPWYKPYLDDIYDAIQTNAVFYMSLLEHAMQTWGLSGGPDVWETPTVLDMSKTVSMLTQITREWSAVCYKERSSFLNRINPFLVENFPSDRSKINLLLPGAGLGRLAVDLVKMGFKTEANEVSYHMLLVGQFILDGGLKKEQVLIYPYVHIFSHQLNRHEQLKKVFVPDIDIADEIGGNDLMSMVAGSFIDLYGPNINIKQSESYSNTPEIRGIRASNRASKDIVITNFFIDTASNILDYLETINHCLKPNGFWINFGPFMYHFESDPQTELTADFDSFSGELSGIKDAPLKGLELSHEDLLEVARKKFNFRTIKVETHIPSAYGMNEQNISMLGYQCSFWILQKPG